MMMIILANLDQFITLEDLDFNNNNGRKSSTLSTTSIYHLLFIIISSKKHKKLARYYQNNARSLAINVTKSNRIKLKNQSEIIHRIRVCIIFKKKRNDDDVDDDDEPFKSICTLTIFQTSFRCHFIIWNKKIFFFFVSIRCD